MSNVLVTGGAGSMGRLVSENLINDGHQVNILIYLKLIMRDLTVQKLKYSKEI